MMLKILHAAVGIYRRLPFPALKRVVHHGWERYQAAQRGRTVIATVDGITYELHLGELIDSNIYYKGAFEPDTTAAISRVCRPGDVVIDIGANIGCHTLRMARLVGDSGRVVAFEPMPWPRRKLEKNLSLNRFHNVIVVSNGLSDKPHRQEVHFRSSWRLTDSDRSAEAPESSGVHAVDFVKLDDYVAGQGLHRIDFIKLDVDGFELKVLRGARETLVEKQPVLLMEIGPDAMAGAGNDARDLVSFLRELGYDFYAEGSFTELDIEAMLTSLPPDGSVNVLAARRPILPVG